MSMYTNIFGAILFGVAAVAAAPWLRALAEALPAAILEEVGEDTPPEVVRIFGRLKAARGSRSCLHWTGGVAFAITVVSFLSLPLGHALALCVFSASVLMLFITDSRSMLLPDVLTGGLFWAGLFVNLQGMFVALPDAVLGGAVGYALLAGPGIIFSLVRRQEGVAPGDPKMLSAVGAWLGLEMIVPVGLAACVVGALYGGFLRWTGKGGQGETPFGPAIALASLGGMLAYLLM